jgi:hypothetical protein
LPAASESRVDRGSCPPRPPTDPDVRDSRIRLLGSWLRCVPQLAPFAGRRPAPLSAEVALIQRGARRPCRISLQPFHVPVPPSLHRVRSGCVPLLHRYYKALRLPNDLPAQLRCLRQRGTTATRRSLTERGGRPSPSCLGFSPDAHRTLVVESSGPPRFLGHPHVCVPRSLTPARPLGLAMLQPWDAAFRYQYSVGSRDCQLFRGSITRPTHSLSTLRSPGYPGTTQDSFPAGALLCRAGVEPAG